LLFVLIMTNSSDSLFPIPTIDCRSDDAGELFHSLREKLSPRGDVVSESGRQRTIELFGEALSPRAVVQRICGDVRERGLSAVLDYTARLDGSELTADTVRVPQEELKSAAAAADPEFLATIRTIHRPFS
jgi:histidinol dehydrogenase